MMAVIQALRPMVESMRRVMLVGQVAEGRSKAKARHKAWRAAVYAQGSHDGRCPARKSENIKDVKSWAKRQMGDEGEDQRRQKGC